MTVLRFGLMVSLSQYGGSGVVSASGHTLPKRPSRRRFYFAFNVDFFAASDPRQLLRMDSGDKSGRVSTGTHSAKVPAEGKSEKERLSVDSLLPCFGAE